MEKGNIKLRDMIAIMSPSQRILIYNKRHDLIYNGYRAQLIVDTDLLEQEYEVKHIDFETQFCERTPENKYGNPLNIMPENAGEYELKDIRIKSFIKLFLF